MEELIEFAVMAAIAIAVAAAIAAAVAATFSIGGLWGAWIATYNYFISFKTNVKPEAFVPGTAAPASGEPAIKGYFFGKGYQDLRATILGSWAANTASAQERWNEAEAASGKFEKIIQYGACFAIFTYGTLLFGLLSVFHIAILGLFYVVIGILFIAVFVVERIYMKLHGFFAVCPFCYERAPLPIYLCDGPGCGVPHHRLIPSQYGILRHRCSCCNQALPATFFLNRGRLPAKCPHCSNFLKRAHVEARKLFVPVIGGPSAGKTAFLVWLVAALKRIAGTAGKEVDFLEATEAPEFEARLRAMQGGTMPAKTTVTAPKAINLTFSRGDQMLHNLYLYDPAGEAFGGEEHLLPHRFLQYCSGILLLIDPFSLGPVRNKYNVGSVDPYDLKPSRQRPDDLLDRLISVLEKNFGLDPSAMLDTPIAIVLTKIDAFDLEKVVGEAALPHGLAGAEREKARNDLIARQLRDWGMTSLVEVIESRFSRRAFFTCSAVGLGARPGAGFTPTRIETPFEWLMTQSATGLLTASDASQSPVARLRGAVAAAAAVVGLLATSAAAGWFHVSEERAFNAAGEDDRRLQNYLDSCLVCWRKQAAQNAIARLQQRRAEASTYQQARGNAARLSKYVAECSICEFKIEAENQARQITQTTEYERRTYTAAGSNLAALRKYVAECSVCEFKAEAQNQITQIERAAERLAGQPTQQAQQPPTGRDLTGLSAMDLCRGALDGSGTRWDATPAYADHVREARRRSYSLDYCTGLARQPTQQAQQPPTGRDLTGLSAMDLCRGALDGSGTRWDETPAYADHVREARRRSYSLDSCRSAAGIAQVQQQPASPSASFTIVNNTNRRLHVAFFDGNDRSQIDPSQDRKYILDSRSTQSYRVDCPQNKLVCYGAAIAGDLLNPYWGVGTNGKQNCTGCCLSCGLAATTTKTLNLSDARQPAPTITWNIVDNTSTDLAVAFYSQTRPQHGWPRWSQHWRATGGANTYTLNCTAGEKICFAAWDVNNVDGTYWGVGPFSRRGCPDCCRICDGGTYTNALRD